MGQTSTVGHSSVVLATCLTCMLITAVTNNLTAAITSLDGTESAFGERPRLQIALHHSSLLVC